MVYVFRMVVSTQAVVAVGTLFARWTGWVAFARSLRETDEDERENVFVCSSDGNGSERICVLRAALAKKQNERARRMRTV
jgi:hypothetical protein